MSKMDWFNFTLINFSANIWDTLIWTHRWLYELIDHLIWAHSCALTSESIQEVRVCMLGYCLQRCPKDCTKKTPERTNLLHIRLELRDLNYQTPFYADYILKYQENCHRIHFFVDNSCNFEVISKNNILKQIYKKEDNSRKNSNLAHKLFIKLFPLKAYKNAALMDYNSR
jgi:hypothetical protein